MSAALYPPSRPLSVGEVLDLGFTMYRATLVKCLPLAALATVLSQLAGIYLLFSGLGLRQPFLVLLRNPTYRTLEVVGVLASLVLSAAILLRQYRLVSGGAPGGELAACLRRAPALVVLAVLVTLALGACVAPAWLLQGPLRWSVLPVLLLPAGYLMISFCAALPGLLLSGAGPLASLERSWRLTRGSFWRLSLIYTVAIAVLVVAYFLLFTAAGFFIALVSGGDLAVLSAAFTVTGIALGSCAVPYYLAVQLAVFADLTARREGTDLAQRITAAA